VLKVITIQNANAKVEIKATATPEKSEGGSGVREEHASSAIVRLYRN
jgi:hypothetical protein